MEMDKAQFAEKLKTLLELGKKKKNVLEYQEINDFFQGVTLTSEHMDMIYEYLESNGVDVLRITEEDPLLETDDISTEEVDMEKYPSATQKYRFEKVEYQVSPKVMQYLETDSFQEKLDIVLRLRDTITEDMIYTMAIAHDINLCEGDVMQKYECAERTFENAPDEEREFLKKFSFFVEFWRGTTMRMQPVPAMVNRKGRQMASMTPRYRHWRTAMTMTAHSIPRETWVWNRQ